MLNVNLSEYLKELELLVNMDSGSRVPGGAAQVADYFQEKYQSLGLYVKRTVVNDFGAPLLEVRNQPDAERIDCLFMGHMDTVFPQGEAIRRPFRQDGVLAYGPGVADMKAGLLSTYYLIKALVEENVDLSFCVLLNSDEEISSVDSQQRIGEIAACSDVTFIMEPGRKNGAYVKERKGLARYRVEVRGIAAHAGIAPQDGASAINEAAYMILKMETLNHYEIGTSVNVGKISGGTAANVVCDFVEYMVDTRFDDMQEHRKIEETLRTLAETPRDPRTTVRIVREGFRPPMRKTEKTEVLMRLMEQKGAELGIDVAWVKTGGGSDGNFAAFAGSTVIDGAGPVGDGAHSAKETMRIDTIQPRLNLLHETILMLAKQKKG